MKFVTMDLIREICKISDPNNNEYLILLMKYSASCFESGVDPRTNEQVSVLQKEALLWIIGFIRDEVMDNSTISNQIEVLLEKYVLPEFKNSVGFLRARACWVFEKYGHIEFKVYIYSILFFKFYYFK